MHDNERYFSGDIKSLDPNDRTELEEKIKKLEIHINRIWSSIEESMRSNSIGVQNVYEKFREIEGRQKSIEELLKSDRIMEVVKAIPSEDDIRNLLLRIEGTEIGRLNKYLKQIRNELDELSSAFNY